MTPPLITLEEHYYSEAIFNALGPKFQGMLNAAPPLRDALRDVGEQRLAAMDRGNIALQIVSHAFTPGSPAAGNCRDGNDELAAAIAKNPQSSRLAGFAVLPTVNPEESARELERAVKSLGFVGALIDNNADGKHYDAPEYDALWAKACELDVPIYLHPTWPTGGIEQMMYSGAYNRNTVTSLGGPGWGWHSDVSLHVLKLFGAHVFDRFPKLKIIIGHMGEMLPFMLERCIDMTEHFGGGWGDFERGLRDVWDENIWLTTSGNWSLAPMKCILDNTKIDRILYSVDYPFSSNEEGRKWFEQLENSGLLTADQLEMIAYKNAETLLKVQVNPHSLPRKISEDLPHKAREFVAKAIEGETVSVR